MKPKTWLCFRCKRERIVGEEIARCDMHAVCYECIGAKSRHSTTTQAGTYTVTVKSQRVKKSPPGPNRSPVQKPDTE